MSDDFDEILMFLFSVAVTFLVYAIGGALFMSSLWWGLLLALLVAGCALARFGGGPIIVTGGIALLVLGVARQAGALPF